MNPEELLKKIESLSLENDRLMQEIIRYEAFAGMARAEINMLKKEVDFYKRADTFVIWNPTTKRWTKVFEEPKVNNQGITEP